MGFLSTIYSRIAGSSFHSIERTICWGTLSQSKKLGLTGENTRPWAHAWIRRHMESLPLQKTTVLDAGSGLSNPLLDWYRPQVAHAYLIDLLASPGTDGNTTIIQADLEQDLPLPDECVDVVTSASSIEHLSERGQLHFMAEAQRLLKPGGAVIMTVSYIFGLDEKAISILMRDPVLVNSGCSISAQLNLQRTLEAAPRLKCPGHVQWNLFPGFSRFREDLIRQNRDVIFDDLGSYGDVRCLPETDAMALKWAEIGLYLKKS